MKAVAYIYSLNTMKSRKVLNKEFIKSKWTMVPLDRLLPPITSVMSVYPESDWREVDNSF